MLYPNTGALQSQGDPGNLYYRREQRALEQQGRGSHLKERGKLKICLMNTAPLRIAQGWRRAEGSQLGISKAFRIQTKWGLYCYSFGLLGSSQPASGYVWLASEPEGSASPLFLPEKHSLPPSAPTHLLPSLSSLPLPRLLP